MASKKGKTKTRQVNFPGFDFPSRLSFGGALQTGRRKSARLFDSKRALHVVLRSSRCTGPQSLIKFERKISQVLNDQCARHGVKIYARANAGNHLHLVLKAPSRRTLRCFLRAITGLIARKVTGRERGEARSKTLSPTNKASQKRIAGSFWDARPFSRVVEWGQDFAKVQNYLHLNRVEAIGFSRHESRGLLEVCRQFGLDPPLI